MASTPAECAACGYKNITCECEYCPECNWEIGFIPANSSAGLKKYWDEKLEKHKHHIARYFQTVAQVGVKDEEIKGLKGYILELESKNNKLNADMKRSNETRDTLKKVISECDQRVNEIKNLTSELQTLKTKNQELVREVKKQEDSNVNNDLRKQNEELISANAKLKAALTKPPRR